MQKKVTVTIILLLFVSSGYGQNKSILNKNTAYSYDVLTKMSLANNAYSFISLGYFLNANNIMYSKTKNQIYLSKNLNIIKNVLDTYIPNTKNSKKWSIQVSENNRNYKYNGSESIVFVGYFFRYVGQFLYIIQKNNLFNSKQQSIYNGLKCAFDKWNNVSIKRHGDQSNLFHQRFHISATWAEVALYLDYMGAKEPYYHSFYTTFDKQLKDALIEKVSNGNHYYIWNSTYNKPFTNALKKKTSYPKVIQDVSHGNHVIEYLITAVKLQSSAWSKDDLKKLSNTILESMYKPDHNKFSDNVDGSFSKNKSIQNTGWKVSDGWMKLIPYNKKLNKLFKNNYRKHQSKIKNSSLSLQFQANIYQL